MAFDKLKQLGQLNKLRQQAKQLQDELEQIVETYEKGNMRIKINGAQKIEYLEIDGEEREDLLRFINDSMKDVQKKAAKKMMEMGGGLGGLLGGAN
jgi:DNA-binding protein YbaB